MKKDEMSRADLDAQRMAAREQAWEKQCKLFGGSEKPAMPPKFSDMFDAGWQAALAAQAPVQGEPVAGDAEDAARYRWLAERCGRVGLNLVTFTYALGLPSGEAGKYASMTPDEVRAAIDAARKADK